MRGSSIVCIGGIFSSLLRASRLVLAGLAGCAFLAAGDILRAEEPFVAFLRALQANGYGEQSLDYIEQIAGRPDLPADLRESLDLERSRSMRLAANEAYDANQRADRLAQSQALLDKFLKERPNHPAMGEALLSWADQVMEEAARSLGAAKGVKDKQEQANLLAAARSKLLDAGERYESARKLLRERLDKLPAADDEAALRRDREARVEIELRWLEARFNLARVLYFTAMAFDDPAANERKLLLEQAALGFDSIFQEYRGKDVALLPHLWHGRVLEELGDKETALEIYDEVLVNAPVGRDVQVEDAPLYGQAHYFRFRCLAATAPPEELVAEGDEWLKNHRKWSGEPIYQGMALETAKAKIALAEKLKSAEAKRKALRSVIIELAEIGKSDSEFQREALLLRREQLEKLGAGEGGLGGDESLALGEAAYTEQKFDEALELFKQAAAAGDKANDAKLKQTAIERLNQTRYRIAVNQYTEGKIAEALATAGEIVKDSPQDPIAPQTSALAVAGALALYASAPADQKTAALERLERIANFTIKSYPDKPEADEARMALAQSHVLRGQFPEATKALQDVHQQSKHFPAALNIAARIQWKSYLDGKKAADAETRQAELDKLRSQVHADLKQSLDRQLAQRAAGETKIPSLQFETQLLLAEVLMEEKNYTEAAALYDPLVQDLKTNPPSAIDNNVLRTFVGAVRAHLAAGAVAPAGAAALALAAQTKDEPQHNAILVDFAKLVTLEAKKAEAAVIEAEAAGDAAAKDQATSRWNDTRQVLGQLLDTLAQRQNHQVQHLVFIGDGCAGLGQADKARDCYMRLLSMVEKDEAAKKAAGAAVTRVRTQLIGLLRAQGKFAEASKQVDELLKTNPNALEPLMEKGRILQSWAETDPKRYAECVAHWTHVRTLLGRVRKRPPEYYEALYNAALCLLYEARYTKKKEKALQAEQILKSTLTLSPSLSGPDMVARYKALLNETLSFQGKPVARSAAPKN